MKNEKKSKESKNKTNAFPKHLLVALMGILGLILFAGGANAVLVLDNINFDPAIIASGDEVDIVIQFRDRSITDEDKVGNPDYKFKVTLEPDDDMTEKYVLFQDAQGDDLYGSVYSGGVFNKKFRVKVANDAPAGTYEFKLNGRWYHEGEPQDSTNYIKFNMDVKREGIIVDIANIKTEPAEIRAGDNYVKLITFVENAGEKDAKSIDIQMEADHEGIIPSYSDNNKVWVGKLSSLERKQVEMYIDLDEDVPAGTHELTYNIEYMDVDNNVYEISRDVPLRIKSRPYLQVSNYSGEGLAGRTGQLEIYVTNTGAESAESVDVRILKESSQPFEFDVRSEYLGELEPGEEAKVIFDIKAKNDADIKEHDFKVLIRSKGDSDEGDDNVYLYNRRAKYEVTGEAPNNFLIAGLAAFGVVIVLMMINLAHRRKVKKNRARGVIRK